MARAGAQAAAKKSAGLTGHNSQGAAGASHLGGRSSRVEPNYPKDDGDCDGPSECLSISGREVDPLIRGD
jgi:hypothetical protein